MKRNLLSNAIKQTLVAVPAAAMMLGAANGAQIGINFWGNGYAWYNPLYAGKVVTATAFGIPAAGWFTTPQVLDDTIARRNSGWPVTPAIGGPISVAWTSENTWSSFIGDIVNQTNCPPGDTEVTWGLLDDTGVGWSVTVSGLRNLGTGVTIQTIAASGGVQAPFPDVTLTAITGTSTNTQVLDYLNGMYYGVDGGVVGTSTVSTAYSTVSGNNSVTLQGGPRNGGIRSTLCGFILTYAPGSNPPIVESNPTAPVGNIYPGGSFALHSVVSGSPTLRYQWRKGGTDILGANFAGYTNNNTVVGDTSDYDVVVTNTYGRATSAVAHVTIQNVTTPVITRSPVSQVLYQGYPATFSVEATGGLLSYQWKKVTSAISGATNATYSIPTVTTNDASAYTVTVSNPVGNNSATATLAVRIPAPGSYEEAQASQKPIVWFRYSDASVPLQDTAANSGSLGSAGLGLYVGNVTHPASGAIVASTNTAANFTGGKVTVPFDASLNPSGPFTVECWSKPTDVNSGSRVLVQSLINGENSGNANDRSGWALRQSGASLQFVVGTDSGSPFYYYYTVAGVLTADTWRHIAVTYDGTAPSIYINGALATPTVTRADGLAITPEEIAAIRILPNFAAPLIVGDRGYGGWTFNGSLDEVAVYGTALTAAKLLSHYQNGVNPTPSPAYNTLVTGDGALEYLRLGEAAFGGGKPANAGTLGVLWNGTYKDGGSVLGSPQLAVGQAGPVPPTYPGFESTNRAVTLTNGYASAPTLNITTATVTVTCWLKREAVSTTGDLSWPAWLGNGGMHLNNGTAAIPEAELRYHWNGGEWGWGSGLFVPAGVWTFVAMVVEPTQATFYMSDGTLLKTSVHSVTHAPMSMSTPLGFGGNQPGNTVRNYIGQIDESAVYDRALTQSEINLLFVRGTGAPFQLQMVPGGIIQDTKPVGAAHNGVNHGATWVASSTDTATPPMTRTGVEQFSAAASSQITLAADPDFNSTVGTIMFWVRVPVAPIPGPGTEAAILFDRRTGEGTVITLNDAGQIFVQCSGGANSVAAGQMVDDLWHLVTCTYDQSAGGFVAIYIDGVMSVNNPNTAAWSWPATQQIELGRSHDGYWKRFDGLMDDFRIYNRVLTDSEVASVYASGALVDTAALKVRFDFPTSGIGQSVVWPFGTLQSSPTVGPGAIWTPLPTATSPYPLMPTGPALFFRGKL